LPQPNPSSSILATKTSFLPAWPAAFRLSPATIRKYFLDLESVFAEILTRHASEVQSRIAKTLAQARAGPLLKRRSPHRP
jgi:hypothetical protein